MTKENQSKVKSPPPSVIAAGYALVRGYEGFMNYGADEYSMANAIAAVRVAIEDVRRATWATVKAEKRGDDAAHGLFYNETGKAMCLLNEAAATQFEFIHMRGDRLAANHFAIAAAREKIRWAHNELFQIIERYGYRAPTQAEFDALGSTGGR
jgi:hypothetical protein